VNHRQSINVTNLCVRCRKLSY